MSMHRSGSWSLLWETHYQFSIVCLLNPMASHPLRIVLFLMLIGYIRDRHRLFDDSLETLQVIAQLL